MRSREGDGAGKSSMHGCARLTQQKKNKIGKLLKSLQAAAHVKRNSTVLDLERC